MMLCVKFVSYSILVNRQPKGFGLFIWGVHQGDSLSPPFFLLCNEGLLSLISQADKDGSIRGFFFVQEKSHINYTSTFCK